jgi:methionine-rich copper-binding protein CopC
MRALTLCGAVVLIACGPAPLAEQRIINVQENSAPTGFISGRVLSAADGVPVAGATISTFADGSVSTQTDANGLYRLGPIPGGNYTVFFEGEGFLKRFFDVSVGNVSAQFPVGNTVVTLDVDLHRPDAKIEGMVITNTGRIAEGATLYLDLRSNGFELVATTTADATGRFEFAGLPGAAFGQSVTVLVAPYDDNDDGVPEFNASARNFSLFPGFTTYQTITLTALGVQLVTSNIADAELQPEEAITLTFSGAIRLNQSTVTLFRNAGSVQIGARLTWDPTATIATLAPVGGPLVEGQQYYVTYTVRAVNGATTTNSIAFTVRPPAGASPLGNVANFRVTAPATTDSGLTTVALAWSPLDDAAGYRIYGKDSAVGSAYLLLSTLTSGLSSSTTTNLTFFDSITGDPFVTPLGHRNHVQLTIVATDRVGNETAFATAPVIELFDAVAPTVSTGLQLVGSANNLAGGAPATVQFQVIFSELMAVDTPPELTLPHAATSAVWAWSSGNRGTFTITIPPGIDGRGTLSVGSGVDTSGNAQLAPFEAALQ